MNILRSFAAWLCLSLPVHAFEMPQDPAAARFVVSNVIGTFYHELGHAMIDISQFPVLGREEDAADTLSVLLIDRVWPAQTAIEIIEDSANAYLLYANEPTEELPYWGVHGLDLQRYYNLICLFYGAAPDARADLANDFELPQERAETCPEEFDQAQSSWDVLLADLTPNGDRQGLLLTTYHRDGPIEQILAAEIDKMNAMFSLPDSVEVTVAICNEANAFYDPEIRRITICTEYAEELLLLWLDEE